MENVCTHDITLEQRNTLITNYMPLANKLAWAKWKRTPNSVDIEELQSAAYMGLVDAANKFQANRNVAFGAYARTRIQGSICDYLREISWGRRKDPSMPVSLDASVDDSNSNIFADSIQENTRDDSHTCEFFEEVTKTLPAIGSKILLLYYVDQLSLKEIGNAVGVSESRVSQVLGNCRNLIEQKWSRVDLWSLAA